MAAIPSICASCLRSMQFAARRPATLRQGARELRRSFVSSPRHATAASTPRWSAVAPSAYKTSPSPTATASSSPPPPPPQAQQPSAAPQAAQSKPSIPHRTILNPRKDEDGNDMLVELTPRAANRLKQIQTTDQNPDLLLRVTVESGGCHGFQYLMSLTAMPEVSQEEDTVFEGPEGQRLVLDEPSLELLKGSKVDYTMELIGSQFKIVDNPAASSSCGCGTSFDVKM